MFERGLERVVADALRDAVLDAYTAFEMYVSEVPVRARYDREAGASARNLRKELKYATSSAELAIGAARATASIVSGEPAPMWNSDRTTKVRNQAIHSGKYPKLQDAETLCRDVAKTIVEFERMLGIQKCVNEAPFHMKVWMEDLEDAQSQSPGLRVLYTSRGLLFGRDGRPAADDSVGAHFAEYRRLPELALRRD